MSLITKYVKSQVQNEIIAWKDGHLVEEVEEYPPILDCVEFIEQMELPQADCEPSTTQEAELQALGLTDFLD
ncbi:MAG: hypothetical protein HN802_02695 [Candidatus Jacksonbacteria bacterium]|jgi:hypothetical protein|nr:hypothetical protein [Candidatus Jacksonbacteria bacterium]